MSGAEWALVCLGVLIALYAVLVVTLAALGRPGDARAIARFVPDCAVLLGRLVRDPDLPWRRRLVLVLVAGYLAMPIDLVPDFLPVIGYLDDAIVVIVTLRWLLSRVGPDRLRAHWPGPVSSFRVVLRLAGAPRSSLSR